MSSAESFDLITQELIGALEEEIAALKKGAGGDRFGLRDGRFTGRTGDQWLYVFLAESELDIPTDSPGQLVVGAQRAYEAVVVSVQGFQATIAVRQDLGERVPAAVLIVAPYYLLEILARRLHEARQGCLPANRHLALAVLGQEPTRPLALSSLPDRSDPAGQIPNDRPPNPEQQAAIRKALDLEVTFIWGPPGTGKTSTVARLVGEVIAAGERALLASHTNAAVDIAFEAVVKRLPPAAQRRGVAVRVGTPQRRSPEVEENTLDAILEERAAGLRVDQQQLQQRKNELQRSLQAIKAALAVLETVRRAEESLQAARDAYSRTQQSLEAARLDAVGAQQRITVLRDRLAKAESMSWLRQVLTGMHPSVIRQELSQAEQSGQAAAQRVATLQQESERSAARLRQAETDYRAALARRQRLEPISDEAELRARQRAVSEDLETTERRLAEIDATIASLRRVVLKEARVVAATLARLSITDELLAEPYDTVVVDEASIVPVPYLWLTALLARRRVLVVGDFRQLPPITAADDKIRYPRADRWLKQDVFQKAGILDPQQRLNGDDPRLACLSSQYRMHPSIGGLVNALVYERDRNPLRHCVDDRDEDVRRGLAASPAPGHALVLCDTSDANPWCARTVGSMSRYNLYSAVVAVRLAAMAAQSHPAITLGLVAPYRAQARLLQWLAERYGLPPDRVRVATVHRFQGDQQDVILLDLVDGPPHRIGRLLQGEYPSEATRLLNVACSRARGKLVVVAHAAHFRQLPPKHSLVDLLVYLGRHGLWLDSRGVVARYDDPDALALAAIVNRAAAPLPKGFPPVPHNETEFYDAFRADLAAARQHVIIFSPFVQSNRVADLMPHLRAALDRGVQVVVVTRPAAKDHVDGTQLRQDLARAGIRVLQRPQMHEKLAVIDREVLWFGSLNILSHSRSTEWMLRFSDPGAVAAMAEVTGAFRLVAEFEQKEAQQTRRQRMEAALRARGSSPQCPKCGHPSRLAFGRYGPFFKCTRPPCDGKLNPQRQLIQSIVETLDLKCPACNAGRLMARWGKRGVFLSCKRYPDCKYTETL